MTNLENYANALDQIEKAQNIIENHIDKKSAISHLKSAIKWIEQI